MSQEGIVKTVHQAILSYEQLLLVAQTAVELGIETSREEES